MKETIHSPYWKLDTDEFFRPVWMYAGESLGWINIMQNTYVGVISLPTITRVGDGTITVGNDGVISINNNQNGTGYNDLFVLDSITLTPIDNSVNYLYADYDSGSPVYKLTTNRDQFLTVFFLWKGILINDFQ